MTASTFNPLEAARDLKAVGIEPEHAEAIAEGMRRAATAGHDALTTKSDVAALKSDIAMVRSEIATLRWMFGLLAALNLAMAAKLFGVV